MTTQTEDAVDLAAAARDVLRQKTRSTASIWPRVAAALARQSIEMAMDRLWRVRVPGLEYTPARCQLLCLATFLGDEEVAERAASAYWALSRVLHHHPYELAPTHAELTGWITAAWDVANGVARATADTASLSGQSQRHPPTHLGSGLGPAP